MEDASKGYVRTRLDNLAIGLTLVALILFVVIGAQLAGVATLICAAMAWNRPFDDNRAKGKPAMGAKGRLLIGAIMGTIALALIITHDDGEVPTSDVGATNLATKDVAKSSNSTVAVKKLSPDEAKQKLRELLEGERQMKREDVEGRLIFWDEIVALAPGNTEYAKQRSDVQSEVEALAPYRDQPQLGGVITKLNLRREGFGNVLVIDITVRNKSRANLVDFEITCETFGNSGTSLGENKKVLYEMVKGRSEKAFRGINMGFIDPQTKRSNCIIDRAMIG
jgi:hypothetical protein